MTLCKYNQEYYQKKGRMIFQCEEQALDSDFCIFHDETQITIQSENILNKFTAKLHSRRDNEDLICIGYHLPELNFKNILVKNTFFNKAIFHGEVNFKQCNFENVSFEQTKFVKKTSFLKSVFDDETNFMDANFQNDANFNDVIFNMNAKFNGCVFNRKSEFRNSRFKKEAFFITTEFSESNFTMSEFTDYADFERAKFHGSAIFVLTKFYAESSFEKSIFEDIADFEHTEMLSPGFESVLFGGDVRFPFSNFKERAYFDSSVFKGKVQFHGTVFSDEALFEGSEFEEECKFKECKFKIANFNNTHFTKHVDFSSSRFEESYFEEAVFKSNTIFDYCKFQGEGFFIKCSFEAPTIFNIVLFENQHKILFDGDLSFVSFSGTDITRVTFADNVKWGKHDKFTVYEAKFLTEKNRIRLQSLMAIYRNLRENYEYHLRYQDAGQFFIKEMDLQRNYKEIIDGDNFEIKKKRWDERNLSFSGLYYHLARYGESYQRPLGIATLLVLTSFFYFWIEDFVLKIDSSDDYQQIFPSLEQSAIRTMSTLSSFFSFEGKGLADYLFRLGWIPVIGTLFISLRRKLERRFRH